MAHAQIMLVQPDSNQETQWAQLLGSFALMKFPPKADLEVLLRLMAAERVLPDLVIADVAYFLRRNQNPFGFSQWLGEHVPGLRLIWTNGASQNISENERTVALRRGAMAILAGIPSHSAEVARMKALAAVQSALTKMPMAMTDLTQGLPERTPDGTGQLDDPASAVIAMRSEKGIRVEDRRYLMKTFPRCFVGSEAVDWLCKTHDITREEAVRFGQVLVARGVFHHVTNDHDFRDEALFYRFLLDDLTDPANFHGSPAKTASQPKTEPTRVFDAEAVDLTKLAAHMRAPDGVDIRDRRYKLTSYEKCFIGSEAPDWIVHKLGATRPQAIRLCERMVDKGLVRHVVEEHHFEDGYKFYRLVPLSS